MSHAIIWFEIPTKDFERAKRFYETVLGKPLTSMESPGRQMAAFPADWSQGEIGGAIVQGHGATPSASGTMVFLNCAPNLSTALGRVEKSGGKVILPKTQIPMQNAGYMAIITDTEGNGVGLHSPE